MTDYDPAMDEVAFDAPAPATWSGAPVACGECGQAGVPVLTTDGWRLPLHALAGNPTANCAGSLAAVDEALQAVPTAPLMDPNIVELAPVAPQEIPEASRAVE